MVPTDPNPGPARLALAREVLGLESDAIRALADQLGTAINGGESVERMGALVAGRDLVYNSGRLYHRDTGSEYREGPYIIFKVVRQSRYPGELPINLARMNREIERGHDADDADTDYIFVHVHNHNSSQNSVNKRHWQCHNDN